MITIVTLSIFPESVICVIFSSTVHLKSLERVQVHHNSKRNFLKTQTRVFFDLIFLLHFLPSFQKPSEQGQKFHCALGAMCKRTRPKKAARFGFTCRISNVSFLSRWQHGKCFYAFLDLIDLLVLNKAKKSESWTFLFCMTSWNFWLLAQL